MKKVILIYPKLGTSFASRPPLSVLILAACLERAGVKVVLLDIGHEPEWRKKVLKQARDSLLVGISAIAGNQIKNGLEVTSFVKENFPGLPVVWGGVHPSLTPEETLKEKDIDIVVRGEGEESLLELVNLLYKGEELDKVLGISFKKKGRIVHNPERPFLDMNRLPDPAWHLIDIESYYSSNLSSKNIALQTSRGCPNRCQFCYNTDFNKNKWRAMSAERVFQMVKSLNEKYGVDGIVFWDDNFFVDFNRVKEFCHRLIESGLKIRWEADCRVDYLARMDDSFFELLKRAGLDAFFVGVESGSERVLKTIEKGITLKQIIKSAQMTAKHKFKVWYAFVISFPEETEEDVEKTIEMMKKIKKINPLAGPAIKNFFPFPGTPFYRRAKEENFVLPRDLAGWGDYRPEDERTPWMRHEFSPYFPICLRFAVDFDRFSGLSKNPVITFFARILHYIEKFRWDHEFYHFPIELFIVKKIAKRLGLY